MVKTHSIFIAILLSVKLVISPSALATETDKIISIGASITEMISDLGLQDNIIAVDSTSLHASAEYSSLPSVGYQRNLSAEGLLSLSPDIIIGTTDMGPDFVVNQLKDSDVELVLFDPAYSVEELKQNIKQLSGLLSQNSDSAQLIVQIEQQVQTLDQIKTATQQQKALFLLSHTRGAPRISGSGTAADALINSLGFRNAAAEFEGYRVLSSESIIAINPEIILVLNTRASPIDKEILIKMLPGIESTDAIVDDKLSTVTGSSLSGGFGPGIVSEMIRILNNLGFNDQDAQSNQLTVTTLATDY